MTQRQNRRVDSVGWVRLEIVPTTIKAAAEFVRKHHRHLPKIQGGLFAVACRRVGGDGPCGVAIVGRPTARMADDGKTCSITRLATDGTENACSKLLNQCRRVAFALGYRRITTHTLSEEPGDSLRAAGWEFVGITQGGKWSRLTRIRADDGPLQKKLKWQSER